MSGLADLAILVVGRFWKVCKETGHPSISNIEAALAWVVRNPETQTSAAWCAVLLSVLNVRGDSLERAMDALVGAPDGGLPSSLLGQDIGFAVCDGNLSSWIRDESDVAVAPRDALACLQSLGSLDYQSIAEIVLAIMDSKISRLSLTGAQVAALSNVLGYSIFVAAHRYEPVVDPILGGFSNKAISGSAIQTLANTDNVYAYFGGSLAERALVSVLDHTNAAGSYLGIPPCCRAYFRKSWESACQDYDGDMAFQLFSKYVRQPDVLRLPWQCNPYAMYQGGGLLWHFPCSIDCASTVRVVNDRFARLFGVDPGFALRGKEFHLRPFSLLPDRRAIFGGRETPGVFIEPTDLDTANTLRSSSVAPSWA